MKQAKRLEEQKLIFFGFIKLTNTPKSLERIFFHLSIKINLNEEEQENCPSSSWKAQKEKESRQNKA